MPRELDYTDYEPYPPMPFYRVKHLYHIDYEQWPKDDPTATQWYWHLYFRGERVNGGLSDNYELACSAATTYKSQHQRQHFLNRYIWDEESYSWMPRDIT